MDKLDPMKRFEGQTCGRCGEVVGLAQARSDLMLKVALDRDVRYVTSTNYVANAEVNPTRVLFANGRTVRIVNGALVVGWARKEAERVFAESPRSGG